MTDVGYQQIRTALGKYDDAEKPIVFCIQDLLEKVKELEAENETLKAVSRLWIPVSDRLPEFPTEVFVKYEGENDHGADFIDSAGKWYMGDANGFKRVITHWMPIPQQVQR